MGKLRILKSLFDQMSPTMQAELKKQGYEVVASENWEEKSPASGKPSTAPEPAPKAKSPAPSAPPTSRKGDIKIDRRIQELEAKKESGPLTKEEEGELERLKGQWKISTGQDYDSGTPDGAPAVPKKNEKILDIVKDWLEG